MKKQYIKPVVTVVKMTESHAIMAFREVEWIHRERSDNGLGQRRNQYLLGRYAKERYRTEREWLLVG